MHHFVYSDRACLTLQLFIDIVDNNTQVKSLEKKHAINYPVLSLQLVIMILFISCQPLAVKTMPMNS